VRLAAATLAVWALASPALADLVPVELPLSWPASPADVKAFFSGVTDRSWYGETGTQIAYYAPDGTLRLYHPGIERVTHGDWQVEPTEGAINFCYRYDANPPGTLVPRDWACVTAKQIQGLSYQYFRGDPLCLAQFKTVPFVLPPRDNISMEALFEQSRQAGRHCGVALSS
jgi:hypothetical protein